MEEKEMMNISIVARGNDNFGIGLALPNTLVDGYKNIGMEEEFNRITNEFIQNINEDFLMWYQQLSEGGK